MAWYPRGFDVVAAYDHLYHCDPGLSGWMQRLGPLPALRGWRQPFNVVDALARAILFQQLSGKAASTIVARIEAVIGSACLYAETLACIDDACLRTCGVSSNKILALRDLTRREVAGELPSVRQMGSMHHNTIVEKLIPIRGIGRWTVEMMLMFRLGRPDVLPVDDLGYARVSSVWIALLSSRPRRRYVPEANAGHLTAPMPGYIYGGLPTSMKEKER